MSAAAFESHLLSAEAAEGRLDWAGLVEAVEELQVDLGCVDFVLTSTLVARLHWVAGWSAFAGDTPELAEARLAVSFGLGMTAEDLRGPAAAAWERASERWRETSWAPGPGDGRHHVLGVLNGDFPDSLPFVVQVEHRGSVRRTEWLSAPIRPRPTVPRVGLLMGSVLVGSASTWLWLDTVAAYRRACPERVC
ncbi:MAG: hypothetical protein KC656_35600, partial [Myxococcales bacterium]|nr:hypothetical protein [Myxococcales bacterium]